MFTEKYRNALERAEEAEALAEKLEKRITELEDSLDEWMQEADVCMRRWSQAYNHAVDLIAELNESDGPLSEGAIGLAVGKGKGGSWTVYRHRCCKCGKLYDPVFKSASEAEAKLYAFAKFVAEGCRASDICDECTVPFPFPFGEDFF